MELKNGVVFNVLNKFQGPGAPWKPLKTCDRPILDYFPADTNTD